MAAPMDIESWQSRYCSDAESNCLPTLSIVLPIYNEEKNISKLLRSLEHILPDAVDSYELIFVDDGSRDGTVHEITSYNHTSGTVRLVELSRNFGKENAILAGYDYAAGRAIVVMDADLQTPAELLPELIAKWRAGADVVDAERVRTEGQSAARRFASTVFYWSMRRLSNTEILPNSSDFRLLDRKVVDHLCQCRERFRFNRGLVSWVGFRRETVPFIAQQRDDGRSRWPFWRLVGYAMDAMFAFSSMPLRLAGLLGAVAMLVSTVYLMYLLLGHIFWGHLAPSNAVVVGSIFVMGGIQLMTLWLVGEYVGRIYEESKSRPLYVAARVCAVYNAGPATDACHSIGPTTNSCHDAVTGSTA